ncbi:MAG: AbrB family transcriptional regulator [Anaerolinea sp.]|nr:AbrB family transcriptional regulator [Anaerolinea sp.]
MTETVRLSEGGRIVLPAKVRRALDLKCGDELLVIVDDGEILLMTRMQGIRRAQRLLAPYLEGRGSLVDELIAERRAEAAREELE